MARNYSVKTDGYRHEYVEFSAQGAEAFLDHWCATIPS